MKRILALVLIVVLALALAACGTRSQEPDVVQNADTQNGVVVEGQNAADPNTEQPVVAVTPTVVVTAFPVPSSTPEPTPEVAPTPTVAPTPGSDGYAAPTATATDEERQNGYTAYVHGNGINVRAEPSSGDTPIIDTVYNGDAVTVIGQENGWTKVIFHNKVGYIFSNFIGTDYPVTNTYEYAAPSNDGNATIIDSNGNATIIGGNDDSSNGTGVIILGP